MTIHIRLLLLAVLLVATGCAHGKNAAGPVAVPDAPPVVQTDDATQPEVASQSAESVDRDEDADMVEEVPEKDIMTEAQTLTPEEKKLLETPLSFPVGLDTEENADVQRYFHYYVHTNRAVLEGCLKRSRHYLPYIRDRFRAEGLPEELIYLPFAESGFNPFALSRAGASGLWQFMPQTGAMYGMKVDAWVDERRDMKASTDAAIKYLKRLHETFGNWPLALAAYNAGEGAIGRAKDQTGCEDFFSLCATSSSIKDETKHYVPKFLALAIISKNLSTLGFESIDWSLRPPTPAQVRVKAGADLAGLARCIGMDWKTFRDMNPILRKQEAPANRSILVAVPGELVAKAEEYLSRPVPKRVEVATYTVRQGDTLWSIAKKAGVSVQELQNANKGMILHNGLTLRVPGKGVPVVQEPVAVAETKKWANQRANYVVREGDTMYSIARQFHADPASLLQANGMHTAQALKVGQKLFVPDAGAAETKVAREESQAMRQALSNYKVQNGDTLWNIAQRFGVTPVQLRQWNKLAENDPIRPGDVLKVQTR